MKITKIIILAAIIFGASISAKSEDYALGNFDHIVTQPAPGVILRMEGHKQLLISNLLPVFLW